MPLIAHSALPTFDRLKKEGENIISPDRAEHQDIRELHIGLLNMMPDAALAATERQFFRLIGDSNQIAQFYIHPFTFDEIERGKKATQYIADYYETFDALKAAGLDALIITGANVKEPDLSDEPYWEPLREVVEWAYNNVTSTLCSCLATHAVMQLVHGQKRTCMPSKIWGVYPHRVIVRQHPLVRDTNTIFDVPHSRFNDVSRQQFESQDMKVLVESEQAGVHLAVSADQFRFVYFQGHPEYDTVSLLKEYKREVGRFANGERRTYPPAPENYFRPQLEGILNEYASTVKDAIKNGTELPEFPEQLAVERLDNTWHDSAEAVINNWIGLVYQKTNRDRRLPFMEGVDPNDPLGLNNPSS